MNTNRSNAGALVGGGILIAFGLLSLASQVFRFLDWGFLWPFIVIGIGALFFAAMFAGGKQAAGFAVPASIVGGVGLILLFQNITGRWEMMSYFWTLIIMFVGAGIYIMGLYGGNENHRQSGLRVMKIGLILFVIFGAFFEMIFSSLSNIIFPVLLIVLGAYLVLARSGLWGGKKSDSSSNDAATHKLEKKETMEQKRSFSLFGPLLLIAAGVIWLLVKAGTIPSGNLWALTHIWPVLLIAAGAGMMLKPFWKYAAMVLDVLVIGGLVLAIVFAPKLGLNNPSSMFTFTKHGGLFIGPGISGSGKVITETRQISGVDAINVEYPAKVVITQGNVESLKIEAEDNLLPDIKTQVRNGTLEIFYEQTKDKHINPTKPIIINVTVKDLAEVDFSSAGELSIDGLKTENLDVSLNGAGNLELNNVDIKKLSVNLSGAGSMTASGTADKLDVNISGFGDFKGADLRDQNASVNISGAGSATVWVDDKLDANISGAGSVNYYGTDKATKQISGVGSVNYQGSK